MFCCLNWIHFMDETEDSIDIKVNFKWKVSYSSLISSFNRRLAAICLDTGEEYYSSPNK